MRIFFLALVFFCLGGEAVQAQTPQLNHQKYWYYRWRLRTHFMKLGLEQGETMILNQRSDTNWMGNLIWGDQTMNLGWYLTILSTEYHQLASNQQNTDQTVKEIYHALWAINRLDLNVESQFRQGFTGEPNPTVDDLNGFIARDDVDQEFYTNNLEHFRTDKVYTAVGNTNWNNTLGVPGLHAGSDWNMDVIEPLQEKIDSGGASEMSQDQIYTLMVGIAMTQRFLPTGLTYNNLAFQDGEKDIKVEAQNILKRILGYCNGTTRSAPITYNWKLVNPETGNPTLRGSTMAQWAWGIGESSCKILGIESLPSGLPPITCSYDVLPNYDFYSHNYFSRSNHLTFNLQVFTGAPYATSNDNAHMFAEISAMKGVNNSWGPHQSGYTMREMYHIPLIRQALFGGGNFIKDPTYEDLLNTAPCVGPYNFLLDWDPSITSIGPFEWSGSDRLLHPHRRGVSGLPGEYNGLDYMVYHNLYYNSHPWEYLSPFDMVDTKLDADLPSYFGWDELGTENKPFLAESFNTMVATSTINKYGEDPANGSADVTFRAGYSIVLAPGFQANSGTEFLAYIDPFECATDNSYKSNADQSPAMLEGAFQLTAYRPHVEEQPTVEYAFAFDETDPEVYPMSAMLNAQQNGPVDYESFLEIYPNPVSDELTLTIPSEMFVGNYTVVIEDMLGRRFHELKTMETSNTIDVSLLPNGLYLVSVIIGNEQFKLSQKFIKD